MKTKIILTILYLATLAGYILAQTPGFNYQAVLRDKDGVPMPNAQITLHISLTDSPSGQVLYKESQTLTSNDLGMLNTTIGTGTVESGNFGDIVGIQNLNIKLEANLPGEPDIVDFGFTPIGASPFALYGEDADADPKNEMQTLSLDGDSLKISDGGATSLESIRSRWRTLPGGNGYVLRLNESGLDRNFADNEIIETKEFSKLGESPNFIKKIIDFIHKVVDFRDGSPLPLNEDTGVTIETKMVGDAVIQEVYTIRNLGLIKKIGLNTFEVTIPGVLLPAPGFSKDILIKLNENGIINSTVEQDPDKALLAFSNILNSESSCEKVNTTTISPDGITRDISSDATGATECTLTTVSDGDKQVYQSSCTQTGELVHKFGGQGEVIIGPNRICLPSSTSEDECSAELNADGLCFEGEKCVEISENGIGMYAGQDCGVEIEETEDGVDCSLVCNGTPVVGMADIGDNTGGISTATGETTTTVCGSPTPGGTTGFCVSLTNNQVATAQGATTQDYGEFSCSNPEGNATVRVSGIDNFGGVILINDDQGTEKIRLGCDSEGKAGIWFNGSQVLGPQTTAQTRKIIDEGSILLVNGEATVYCHHEFREIADPKTMFVHLTPGSANSQGLAVVEKFAGGFKMKELHGGTGNYSVDWQVSSKLKDVHNRSTLPKVPDTELIKNNKVVDNLTFFTLGRTR